MRRTEGPTAGVAGPHGGQPVVTAGAPRGATEAVVVALHGRGATAQGIVNLLDPVYRHGVTFLAPQAERSRWYPDDSAAPVDRNDPHVSSALGVMDALVKDAPVTRDRVVLLGFSQGAAVAAEYAARNPARYGGVAVLSGALLGPDIDPANYAGDMAHTPVLVGCGAADTRLDHSRVRDTAAVFRSLGGDVTERVYEGVGHEVTDDEFAFVGAVLDGLIDARET